MGVPALFRWLSQKYPKIISPVIEELPREVDGQTFPVNTEGPNPNGEEFDNLYLDMNGIVHPCSHPEDRPPPATEEEMMLEVFKYTDRVVKMVRPRKLLMIAVDGVAPRAKMNQQRSRRFRSAQEAKEKDDEKAEFLKLLRSQGGGTLKDGVEEAMNKKTWDSNAITPGTPFMDILAASLRYWVAYKLNEDPAWEKLKIIISDATVPGEGEHKIMEFIRSQRRSPEHDPNTRHVIYGLDADLIMLGLATHEPHFRVLREDVFFQESKARNCRICGQTGHRAEECRGEIKKKEGDYDEKQKVTGLKPFIWLHVSILREYLAIEMNVPDQPFKFDLERALDDWVFMCFFVGNDFLPHLPSLDIREQGIDTLIAIWRDNIPVMGGYVTKDGHVNLERTQIILEGLAKQEASIFKRRKAAEDRKENNAKRRKLEADGRKGPKSAGGAGSNGSGESTRRVPAYSRRRQSDIPDLQNMPIYKPSEAQSTENRALTHELFVNRSAFIQGDAANKSAAAVLKEQLLRRSASTPDLRSGEASESEIGESGAEAPVSSEEPNGGVTTSLTATKRKAELLDDDSGTPGRHTPESIPTPKAGADVPPEDTVRLWEEGYTDRYYEQKFKADPKDKDFRRKVALAYVEGLAWVLLYYFQGCPSWTWYYPYHYAPFAEDFTDIAKLDVSFEKGVPFRPYEQLMGVLPAASNHAIPEVFRGLMSDEDSEIIDFYPQEFPIDLNGKKFAWQGVALLPFIDEKRLLKAMATKYPLLTPEEKARNAVGRDVLLFSTKHPLYEEVAMNFYSKKQGSPTYKLNSKTTNGLAGKIEKNEAYIPQSSLTYPLPNGGMPDLDVYNSIGVHYEMPASIHVHKSMLLRGAKFPPPALDRADVEATRNRSSRTGRSYGGATLRVDNYRPDYDNGNNSASYRGYNDRQPGGPGINYDNPFAAHLNPNFNPAIMGRAPPPPHMMSGWGAPPPPPHGGRQPPTHYPGGGDGGFSYGYGYAVQSRDPSGARPDRQQGYQNQATNSWSHNTYGYGQGDGQDRYYDSNRGARDQNYRSQGGHGRY